MGYGHPTMNGIPDDDDDDDGGDGDDDDDDGDDDDDRGTCSPCQAFFFFLLGSFATSCSASSIFTYVAILLRVLFL